MAYSRPLSLADLPSAAPLTGIRHLRGAREFAALSRNVLSSGAQFSSPGFSTGLGSPLLGCHSCNRAGVRISGANSANQEPQSSSGHTCQEASVMVQVGLSAGPTDHGRAFQLICLGFHK